MQPMRVPHIHFGLWFSSIMSAANRTKPTIATILLMRDSNIFFTPFYKSTFMT